MSATVKQDEIDLRQVSNKVCTLKTDTYKEGRVEDFGAKGDGILDDTDAFKRAIAVSNFIILNNGSNYLVNTDQSTGGIRNLDHSVTWITNGAQINGVDVSEVVIGNFLPHARGQLHIMSDTTKADLEAGESVCIQAWVGDNPTATPGLGGAVVQTNYINNLRNRSDLWGLNCLVQQVAGGTDGLARSAEFEASRGIGVDAIKDPFGAATWQAVINYVIDDSVREGEDIYFALTNNLNQLPSTNPTDWQLSGRFNGVEIVAHTENTDRVTSGLSIWAAENSGVGWWNEGLSVSRCVNNGLHFYVNPAGSIDGISPFQNAAIFDESNSESVLKVVGTHNTSIIDIGGANFQSFVQMDKTANQTIEYANHADFSTTMQISSGNGVTQQCTYSFADNSVAKWSFIKNASNDFAVYDEATGRTDVLFDTHATDPIQIYVGGTLRRVLVGAAGSANTALHRELIVAD